ncbi:class I SAM-dependent methyltransferase [Ferrimonas balearica]|nr:class I SAM-dependent methyltransferase [Ferrimonas balearica]
MSNITLTLLVIIVAILIVGGAYGYRYLRRLSRKMNQMSKDVSELAPFIWATNSLCRRDDLVKSLPNWNTWSIPPDTMIHILDEIEARRPSLIVEFGAGLSTILIASQLKGFHGKLISYEHDAIYAEHIKSMLHVRGLSGSVEIRVKSLTAQKFSSYEHPWYDLDADTLPMNADLVIVDGPPKKFGDQVRLPAGDLMATRLAPGGSILFDDMKRDGEQAIKRFLMEKYEEFHYLEPPSIRGLLVMNKPV